MPQDLVDAVAEKQHAAICECRAHQQRVETLLAEQSAIRRARLYEQHALHSNSKGHHAIGIETGVDQLTQPGNLERFADVACRLVVAFRFGFVQDTAAK